MFCIACMDRNQKFEFCKKIQDMYTSSSYAFLANVSNVDAKKTVEIRNAVRKVGAPADKAPYFGADCIKLQP